MIRSFDDGSDQVPAEELLHRLKREADIWSKLKHENVLPFIGVCDDFAPCPVLIAPFCTFGHVGTYLRKNPSADRYELIRGVGSGLQFLHDNDIVHGDLKMQNVLVDKRGVPCICDFGISKILDRRGFSTPSVGTVPYMAPELFIVFDRSSVDGTLPNTTKASDVYSFALLVLEILTSEPLKKRPRKQVVSSKVLEALRPKRADYDVYKVADEFWMVLDHCWAFDPLLRPTIGEVLGSLSALRGYRHSQAGLLNAAKRIESDQSTR
ncbi:kinase-like domain-containing protein [Mycena pura]|uniref:Kinase-like domain-containing protein n=1 Tax=Mycena pura TaxID=153505 RepID=A0AAD6V8N9_9AGAR|nr:kinase-like domain-containing protein [Mycena pura]